MPLDGSFVDSLVAQTKKPQVLKVNGLEYLVDADGKVIPDAAARSLVINPFALSTLSGIVDYLTSNRDSLKYPEILVQVAGPRCVDVYGPLGPMPFHSRAHYARAAQEDVLTAFTFGTFYETEKFIVLLQSVFAEGQERDEVMRLFASVKDETVGTSDDDGFTQTVTAKRGLHLVAPEGVPMKNPVELAPFRTFLEVAQPPSPFVLRVKPGEEGGKPKAALFEADGGLWKIAAIGNIATFLREKLPKDVALIA